MEELPVSEVGIATGEFGLTGLYLLLDVVDRDILIEEKSVAKDKFCFVDVIPEIYLGAFSEGAFSEGAFSEVYLGVFISWKVRLIGNRAYCFFGREAIHPTIEKRGNRQMSVIVPLGICFVSRRAFCLSKESLNVILDIRDRNGIFVTDGFIDVNGAEEWRYSSVLIAELFSPYGSERIEGMTEKVSGVSVGALVGILVTDMDSVVTAEDGINVSDLEGMSVYCSFLGANCKFKLMLKRVKPCFYRLPC